MLGSILTEVNALFDVSMQVERHLRPNLRRKLIVMRMRKKRRSAAHPVMMIVITCLLT